VRKRSWPAVSQMVSLTAASCSTRRLTRKSTPGGEGAWCGGWGEERGGIGQGSVWYNGMQRRSQASTMNYITGSAPTSSLPSNPPACTTCLCPSCTSLLTPPPPQAQAQAPHPRWRPPCPQTCR
jgi:hypothetical protein